MGVKQQPTIGHQAASGPTSTQSIMMSGAPQPGGPLDTSFSNDSTPVTEVTLSNGSKVSLVASEHQALTRFAAANDLTLEAVLKTVTITDGRVTSATFDNKHVAHPVNITTLEGLSELTALRELEISWNPLTSLKGIPASVEHLYIAHFAGRDLTSLKRSKLSKLTLFCSDITSLEGAPKTLKYLKAERCRIGPNLAPPEKLSELRGLTRLQVLCVDSNPSLESLEGTPTKSLRHLSATQCRLHGEQAHHLKAAAWLTSIDVAQNPSSAWVNRELLPKNCRVDDYNDMYPVRNVRWEAYFSVFATLTIVGTVTTPAAPLVGLGFYAVAAGLALWCRAYKPFTLTT